MTSLQDELGQGHNLIQGSLWLGPLCVSRKRCHSLIVAQQCPFHCVQGSGQGSGAHEALPFPRRLWAGEDGEAGAPVEKWVPLDHEFDSVKAVGGLAGGVLKSCDNLTLLHSHLALDCFQVLGAGFRCIAGAQPASGAI